MDKFDEKKAIYEQMKLLSEERSALTKTYFELKERITLLDAGITQKSTIQPIPATSKKSQKENIEYQRYMMGKKQRGLQTLSYSIISIKIASLLKSAGRPLSNKELFLELTEKQELMISYRNLTNNILPRINKDKNIHVERAYRGYWQYRFF